MEHLDQAVRLSEKEFGRVDGEILEHIGDVHHSAGRLEEARKWWTRSSAAYKEDEVPEDATRVEEKLEQLPESISSRQTERTH